MAAGCLVWAVLIGVDVEHTQAEQRLSRVDRGVRESVPSPRGGCDVNG